MTTLHLKEIIAPSSEKKQHPAQFGSLARFLHLPINIFNKMLLNFIRHNDILTSEPSPKVTLSKNKVDFPDALTESSTTCEDSHDELTLDGSSTGSSDEVGDVTNGKYTVDVPFILEEEKCDNHINEVILIKNTCFIRSESEYCAVVMIQDAWHRWQQTERIKSRLAEEVHASHIISRTWRTWCSRNKARILKMKMREIAAVTLIQVNWQNYLAKIGFINHLAQISRQKTQEEEEEIFAHCKRLEDEILTFFS